MRYIKSFLRNKYISHHCKICFWQQAHLVCHYVHLQRQTAVFGLHLFPLLKPFLALHTLYLEYSWVIILLLRHWDWMHLDCLLYLLFILYVFSPFLTCCASQVLELMPSPSCAVFNLYVFSPFLTCCASQKLWLAAPWHTEATLIDGCCTGRLNGEA
jgi:hypothetical protein